MSFLDQRCIRIRRSRQVIWCTVEPWEKALLMAQLLSSSPQWNHAAMGSPLSHSSSVALHPAAPTSMFFLQLTSTPSISLTSPIHPFANNQLDEGVDFSFSVNVISGGPSGRMSAVTENGFAKFEVLGGWVSFCQLVAWRKALRRRTGNVSENCSAYLWPQNNDFIAK